MQAVVEKSELRNPGVDLKQNNVDITSSAASIAPINTSADEAVSDPKRTRRY